MNLDDVLARTALEQAALIQQREISSVELVTATLARIDKHNPRLQAFVVVDHRRALRDAAERDQELRATQSQGGKLRTFHGVPTAIKDLNFVRGWPTRLGSRGSLPIPSPLDDNTVKGVRRGGFVLVGKTSTSELGAMPVTEPGNHPPTRNPWNTSHSSGGSSGGASSAVAGGLLALAQGSDGGGSVRLPSGFCHLFGIKPSRGRIANAFGRPDRQVLYTSGPLAHSVADAAAFVDVLAGLEVGLPHWAPPPPKLYRELIETPPQRLRIRLATTTPLMATDPEIKAAVDDAARVIAGLGHDVEEAELPVGTLEEFLPLWQFLIGQLPFLRRERLQPTTRWLRDGSKGLRAADVAAQHTRLAQRLMAVFNTADVWLTPTSPCTAPKVGSFLHHDDGRAAFEAAAPIGSFTALFNITGQPAASVPLGLSKAGLPMGLQIAGREGADDVVLALARQLEQARPWIQRRAPSAA